MSPSDEAAMNRWTGHRDAEAFRALVQRYAGTVYATCRRILGDSTAAEDITQECFETLARSGSTAQIRALGPWLHGVATKRCLVHIRSEGRRRQREANYVSEKDSQTEIQWSDIYEYIDEAIAALPYDLREPLVAHYLYGDSHADIARATGTPRRTVSSRIQRGVELVGDSLKARGIVVSSVLLVNLCTTHLTQAAVVPQSLAITLGKLALAGTGSAVVATAAAGPAAALFSAKGIGLLIAAVATVTVLTVLVSPEPPPETPAVPAQQASEAPLPRVQTPAIQAIDRARVTPPSDASPAASMRMAQATDQTTPPGAVIEGTVTFNGEPAADLMVVGSPYAMADPVFAVSTDAQGYYRVEGLEAQELTIFTGISFVEGRKVTREESEAGIEGPVKSYSDRERVKIGENQTLRLDFELPKPAREPPTDRGRLQGNVLVDGEIPEEALIVLQSADNRHFWTAEVEPDGSYSVEPTPAGDYFVKLGVSRPRSERMEWWTRAAIFVNEVTTLDIDADRSHTGTLDGRLENLRDGEAGSVVAFMGDVFAPKEYSATWLSEVDAPVAAMARIQRDEYLMGNLAPGTYTVVAVITSAHAHVVPHYGLLESRIVSIEAEGDVATADFEFISDEPPLIEGILVGLHPEDGAWVNVYRGEFPMPIPYRPDIGPVELFATQIHANQRRDLQFWNLEPGTYSLWAHASPSGLVVGTPKTDWTIVTIPENQETPITVELAPVLQTYKATIHCRLANLRPDRPEVLAYALPGAQEIPSQVTGKYWQETHLGAASSDRALDSETLTLTGLDPGAYTVIAFHFPVRNRRENRDAAGISGAEFYAATLVTSSSVTILKDNEEISLELSF